MNFSGYGPPRSTALAGSSDKALNDYMVVSTVTFGAPGSVWQKVDVSKNEWAQRPASSDPDWTPQKFGELNSLVKVGSDYYWRKSSGALGWQLVTPTVVSEQPPPTVVGTPEPGDLYSDTRTDGALYQYGDGTWTLVGAGEGGAPSGLGIYGDGSDGNYTVAATTETIWAPSTAYGLGDKIGALIPNGHRFVCTNAGTSDTTEPTWDTTALATTADNDVEWTEDGEHVVIANRLSRDAFFDTLTVPSGFDLETGGCRLFAQPGGVILEAADSIICNDGSFVAWEAPGIGPLGEQAHGGEAVTTNDDGELGDSGMLGLGAGGAGGDAAVAVGAAGGLAGGDQPIPLDPHGPPSGLLNLYYGIGVNGVIVPAAAHSPGVTDPVTGVTGAGGGSGGNDTGAGTISGAGGGGGGFVFIAANRIVNNGIIRAKGGDGGDASGAGIAGGGGGGGGGYVLLFCDVYDDSGGGTLSVDGGTGGAGVGAGGLNGAAGEPGFSKVLLR